MPARRLVAAAVVMALVGTACGARVDQHLREAVVRQQTGQVAGGVGDGLGGQSASGSNSGGSAGGGISGGISGGSGSGLADASGGAAAGGGSATSGASGSGLAGSPTATLPPGGNGGATDVGVTADSVTVGSVTTLSGPVPGLFEGAVYGARAYFEYQNSLGGVFQRRLKLSITDDQLDCGQNRTAHLAMVPNVLAFVSSLSLYDNCGAPVLAQHPDVADVSLAFSKQAGGLANNFSIQPLVPGYRLGSLEYYKAHYPTAVTKVGTLVGNIGSAVEIWNGIKAAMTSIGYGIGYEREYTPGETDFTADVVRMREAGVQMLYFVSADAHTIARVAKTAAQQNWKPLFAVGAGDAMYDPGFIAEAGGVSEGIVADQPVALYFGKTDAQNIPGVALYQQWMSQIGQSDHEDLYSAWGWGQAALFVQALQAVGPHVTRAGLIAALGQIHRFDAGGMFSPADPASKKPATCYVMLHITHGQFERLDSPPNQFRCDGGYFYYKG